MPSADINPNLLLLLFLLLIFTNQDYQGDKIDMLFMKKYVCKK